MVETPASRTNLTARSTCSNDVAGGTRKRTSVADWPLTDDESDAVSSSAVLRCAVERESSAARFHRDHPGLRLQCRRARGGLVASIESGSNAAPSRTATKL